MGLALELSSALQLGSRDVPEELARLVSLSLPPSLLFLLCSVIQKTGIDQRDKELFQAQGFCSHARFLCPAPFSNC